MNFIHVREKKVAPKGLELPILGGAEIDRILIHLLQLKALCAHQTSVSARLARCCVVFNVARTHSRSIQVTYCLEVEGVGYGSNGELSLYLGIGYGGTPGQDG